jgi:hypothetical protein
VLQLLQVWESTLPCTNIHLSHPSLSYSYLAALFALAPLSCSAVNPKHLASAIEQSPEAFAVSLCAAIRTMCAVACSRASQPAAAAATAGLGELSLLPVELTSGLPPEALLAAVNTLASVAIETMSASSLAKAMALAESRSSSSSTQYAGQPFMVSLMLTAQKCATALRGACLALALEVARTVGRSRIQFPTHPGSHVWRDAPESASEWRKLYMKLGSKGLRSRLQSVLSKTGSDTAKAR